MSVDVLLNNETKNPSCPHGPTPLFVRYTDKEVVKFYACSACRDRKDCNFFILESDLNKMTDKKKQFWENERMKYTKGVNHRKLYVTLNEITKLTETQRYYCSTCSKFDLPNYKKKHEEHELRENVSDYDLMHPTTFLKPLENSKKEAQYLFSDVSVKTITDILLEQNCKNVICMGTPKLHEYLTNKVPQINSLLLDIDKRYHSFFGPLQFCWYNMFNNHFFMSDAKDVFQSFLQCGSEQFVLILDPPFGGRIELLACTIKAIDTLYKRVNKIEKDLPVMLVLPYFMEPQILNALPNFKMCDYKIDYINHQLFTQKRKGRKYESPVRFFTNIDLRSITLPKHQGYKYCKLCEYWVSNENDHCNICNGCVSKDGRTYVHCHVCGRCVKPTWRHCEKCERCALPIHECSSLVFTKTCFHCKQRGHKRDNCPKVRSVGSEAFEIGKDDEKIRSEARLLDGNNLKSSRSSFENKNSVHVKKNRKRILNDGVENKFKKTKLFRKKQRLEKPSDEKKKKPSMCEY